MPVELIELQINNEQYVEAQCEMHAMEEMNAANDVANYLPIVIPTEPACTTAIGPPASNNKIEVASTSKISTPTRKRTNNYLKKNALEYLNDKGKRDYKAKEKELELREREVKVAERKLDLDEKRLRMEVESRNEDRAIIRAVLEKQFQIIEMLPKKLDK